RAGNSTYASSVQTFTIQVKAPIFELYESINGITGELIPQTNSPAVSDNKKPEMSVDAKHKDFVPQTRDGEQVVAKPGINSSVASQKEVGANSKQVAVREIEKERSLSQEAKDKEFAQQIKKSVRKQDLKPQFQQASGKVTNMAEIIRMHMLMQAQQKTA
ncbi:MAG: hypothetical protein J6R99_00655, partial [Alphaproteobacteria bacterium]|nr:hypothetical protein [Alphaproteobacteria bacterium]